MDAAVKELFGHLVRHVAEPLLGVSPEGEILLSCPSAGKLLGRDEDALRSVPLASLALGPPEKVHAYLRMCARSLAPLPGALELVHASGQGVPCRCKGALLTPPSGSGSETVVLLRLIPRHGSQSPFALLNQKITDLTREVMTRKRAEQDALAAIAVRDDFLAVASHEIKTPLHSLKLQLELVTRALGTLDAFTLKRLEPRVSAMRRQLDRLAILSSSLLDLTAISSGRVTCELGRYDVAQVVQVCVDGLATRFAHAGSELRLDLPPGLLAIADPTRLEQILVNLLSNAAKYGAGRPVAVSASAEGDRVTVAVTDGGIGISAEDLPRVFDKFERAVSGENYGGLGLGLYIASQLAEAMGGRITARSTLGKGSTFTLELPRAAALPLAVEP